MKTEIEINLARALKRFNKAKADYDDTGYKCHRWDLEEAESELKEAQEEWLREFEESVKKEKSKS